MPPDDPVKVIRLKLRNAGRPARAGCRRRSTPSGSWARRATQTALHVVTEVDAESGALLARNAFNARTSPAGVALRRRRPAAAHLHRRPHRVPRPQRLAWRPRRPWGGSSCPGRVGAALDPCAALQATFDLGPGRGTGGRLPARPGRRRRRRSRDLAAALPRPGRGPAACTRRREARWDDVLGAVQVRTPDPALDLLLNRWLLYQVLACRLWGRSAFYQSGGAYGFRDQLQDVLALVHAAPEEARAASCCAPRPASSSRATSSTGGTRRPAAASAPASPTTSSGCRSSPATTSTTTGDAAVLDETRAVPDGARSCSPDQEEDYGLPDVADETAARSTSTASGPSSTAASSGPHGLPLMGTGDWNDGMNRVGAGGQGESVWVAWFLIDHPARLRRAGRGARRRRPGQGRAANAPSASRQAVEEHAWDGELVSPGLLRRRHAARLGAERRVPDRLARPVVGGDRRRRRPRAGPPGDGRGRRTPGRAARIGLILLFTPPFDHGPLEPGYIKGYVPGIRENGGQYTHAATWVRAGRRAARPTARAPCELFDLLNPIRHADTPRGGRAATRSSRTSWRRRLRPAAAHRPRRLDLVHRLGRLALPRRPGDAPRLPAARATGCARPVHPRPTGRASSSPTATARRPTGSSSRTRTGVERGVRAVTLDGTPLHGERSRSPTTAATTRFRSSWERHEPVQSGHCTRIAQDGF